MTRYDPSGKKERDIRLPVPNVTCCAFGGPAMDELYLTTARTSLDEAGRRQHPQAGDLFRVKVGVTGVARPPFAG